MRKRSGKSYDNLDQKKDYIENLIREFRVNCEVVWCDNQNQALDYMMKNNLRSIVCQDAHKHGKVFCDNPEISVFSIGVGFDTLHHANDVRLGRIKNQSYPDIVYFPSEKIKDKFLDLVGSYPSKLVSVGSPIFDHEFFVNKVKKDRKVVTFFVTLQSLVTKELQEEIENFASFCSKNKITLNIKTKVKTPWVFKDSKTYETVNISDYEAGFPATSISLMLNSDVVISSYSTCSIEADYFGIPCINLDSVEEKKLTYAVKSIKFDYDFEDMYSSESCQTISKNLEEEYLRIANDQSTKKEKAVRSYNNSQAILRDIVGYL